MFVRGNKADGIRVAIAGGSIAGLAAAAALRSQGCSVEVYEQTLHRMTSRGAGIVVQPSLTALISEVGAPTLPITHCTHRNYLTPDGGDGTLNFMPQHFTSWEAIYTTLLAALPEENYHLGAKVVGFEQNSETGPVAIQLGDGQRIESDLLICADGWRSAARTRLLPEITPRYAGYVAWRGTLAEAEAPADLVRFFDGRFTFSDARSGGHALCYVIPGDGAGTLPGQRRLNWVWYVHVHEGPSLKKILTDRQGVCQPGSVQPGQLADAAIKRIRDHARQELHSRFADLISATPEPFVQVILDLAAPKMRFGCTCLVGDAAFIVRPHTAGAAAKAADNARALALAAQAWRGGNFDVELARWEAAQLSAGRAMMQHGVALGQRFASVR